MIEDYSVLLYQLPICFFLGSIPFALIAMAGSGIDIRKVGSGNPGFNNVLRVSKPRAVIALAGDMGKGYLAVTLFLTLVGNPEPEQTLILGWLYGFAVVLGHCYSPFLKFRGGKGIASSGGVMLVLYPTWTVFALATFVAVRLAGSRLKWREAGAIASLSAWVVFMVILLLFLGRQDAAFAAFMTLFLAWKHKKNFQNLLSPA